MRKPSGHVGWVVSALLGTACTSTAPSPMDGSTRSDTETPAFNIGDGADVASALTDATTRADAAPEASTGVDAVSTDVPGRPVAPLDPCDPDAVIDLDRAGVVADGEVFFEGTTLSTQEDLGTGPRPACFAWPQHPRFFRWHMRSRATLYVGAIPAFRSPDMVAWAAAGCSRGARPLGCTVAPRGEFQTEVLDAGTMVWIGVASVPARDVHPQSTVGAFTLWMMEVAPPALGDECSRTTDGFECPAGAHCAESFRCVLDGAEGGLCIGGTTCDAGLACSPYGFCEPIAGEGEQCDWYGRACTVGTRCVYVDSTTTRCLRERSEGGACVPAPGLTGLCEPGLVCNVEYVRLRGLATPSLTDQTNVARCRPAVGEGEVCGAQLRRPCADGLACIIDGGGVGHCVRDGTPSGAALGDRCYGYGCRAGLLCAGSRCVIPAGDGAPCDRDADCEPSFFCARSPGYLGTCTRRPSPRERCSTFDGTLACVDGWRCGPHGTSIECESRGSLGQGCSTRWPQCDEGLVCDGMQCVTARGAGAMGARCRDDALARCDAGLACDPLHFVCGRSLLLGAACSPESPADGVCEPGTYCAPPGRCMVAGSDPGPCGGPCLDPGDVGGTCAPGAMPCRAGLRCVATNDASPPRRFCAVPVGEGGACYACADGFACNGPTGRCARIGTVGLLCDSDSAATICGPGLACVDGNCIPPTRPGSACILVDRRSLCSPGQTCVGGTCVAGGTYGTSCRLSAPCQAGLFCGDYICRRPSAAGACPASGVTLFSEAAVTCGPDNGCLIIPCSSSEECATYGDRSTCAPRGVAMGPCRDHVPWCDAGLACSSNVCVPASSVGLP